MDTPEAEISAIEAGTMEPLPVYAEHDHGEGSFQTLLAMISESTEGNQLNQIAVDELTKAGGKEPQPIHHYPEIAFGRQPDELMHARQTVVRGFFDAISKEQDEAISLFLNSNLVTANTTMEGKTPLLAAVMTKNTLTVRRLLGVGAEPDAFGTLSKTWDWHHNKSIEIKRTPLQLAASIGHLPLVKLFMEVYHCDDSLIAPDGQIALRLAAANKHREVVAYLPARRGGGFLRWKTEHQKAIRRAQKALTGAYKFLKFFLFDIEKFFLWTIPKHAIVKPICKGCVWCWKNRKHFGGWCKRQALQIPARVRKFGSGVWKGVKKVPEAVAETSKALWNFVTQTLPRWCKRLVIWFWELLTTRIPRAIAILASWIGRVLSSAAKAILDILLKALSFLHTAFSAIFSFFQNLTLSNLWTGFCDLLRSIFISFPQVLWNGIKHFGNFLESVLKALFGLAGEALYAMVWGLGWLVTYVPRKIWVVLESIASSIGNAGHELRVWVSPKA